MKTLTISQNWYFKVKLTEKGLDLLRKAQLDRVPYATSICPDKDGVVHEQGWMILTALGLGGVLECEFAVDQEWEIDSPYWE